MIDGKPEHFEQSHMITMLPPVFHLPEMDMPLRNTKRTLSMAKLEANTGVKRLDLFGASSTMTNPVYTISDQLMAGVEGQQFLLNDINDADELANVVEAACKEVLRRTGGAGFPVLCNANADSKISIVKRGVERTGGTALVYHRLTKECCSEAEVEDWLRRRRIGEEEKCLITDEQVSS